MQKKGCEQMNFMKYYKRGLKHPANTTVLKEQFQWAGGILVIGLLCALVLWFYFFFLDFRNTYPDLFVYYLFEIEERTWLDTFKTLGIAFFFPLSLVLVFVTGIAFAAIASGTVFFGPFILAFFLLGFLIRPILNIARNPCYYMYDDEYAAYKAKKGNKEKEKE